MTLRYEDETGKSFPNEISFHFSPEEQTRILIRAVCEYIHCPYEVEVSLLLVGKETIQEMNNEFRGINRPTDVLSFPMSDFDEPGIWSGSTFKQTKSISPETGELLLGDIVICTPMVKEQAREYGHSEEREFSFLIVHSLLHLSGFDHMEEEERIQMEEKQREILDICNISRDNR